MENIKELEQFYEIETKLAALLAENNLVHRFYSDGYPISLTIAQSQDPADQMELFEADERSVSASDARLNFIFQDGDIIVRTDSRLVISDALLSKIKGFAKKMHYLYLQAYHRQHTDQK